MPRVLLIEDQVIAAKPALRVIEHAGARVVDWAPTAENARFRAVASEYDILVADFDLGPGSPTGVEVLEELRDLHPAATCVCISASVREVPGWLTFVSKLDLASGMTSVIATWAGSPG